jgi:hypothetical protein
MINPKTVIAAVTNAKPDLELHCKTLDILEGNLEPYILKALERQLSPRVFAYAKERMVPINIMPRYVDKLSNIYQTGVAREVLEGDQSDSDLLAWYEKELSPNKAGNLANRLYNACGSALYYPFMGEDGPELRVIANDKFVVVSEDPINPLKPTMVILMAGKDSEHREVYWVYTDYEFAVIKSDESVDYNAMAEFGLADGINPYSKLPFIYINSSELRLHPVPDKDTLRMTEFVPVALTDLNLAAMFSAFSVTYITNGSVENLTYAPNALWFLKSDDPEKDVQIGTLKPEVDYSEVLNLIQSELSMWMGTKGIKSGSVGNLTVENSSSGIAKMIDEADTFEVRQEQTVHFSHGEHELWELILRDMHPVWVSQGLVENRSMFSPSASVETKFSIVPVGTQRTQLIADQKEEYAAGFTTRARAIQALNPQMTMTDVEALIQEIEDERSPSDGNEMATSQNQATNTDNGPGQEGRASGSDNREDSGADGSGEG